MPGGVLEELGPLCSWLGPSATSLWKAVPCSLSHTFVSHLGGSSCSSPFLACIPEPGIPFQWNFFHLEAGRRFRKIQESQRPSLTPQLASTGQSWEGKLPEGDFWEVCSKMRFAQLGPCQPPAAQLSIPKQSQRFSSPMMADVLLFPLSSDYPPSGMVSSEQTQRWRLFPHGLQRYHPLPAAEGKPGQCPRVPHSHFWKVSEVLRMLVIPKFLPVRKS